MLEIPPPPPPKPRIVLPWSEYDPGLLNGDGVAVRKCSIDFLASLYKTFLDTYRPDEVNLSPEEAERLTESVRQELTRLTNYPDLFPTPTAQERFFKILQESVAKVVKKREDKESESIEESIRLRANLIARDEEQILQSINRPSFKPELKPWEQFLLKGSPGSGVALSEDPPNGYVQMMPMGGLALHRMWLKNTYIETRRYREEVANGSEPASDEHFAQRTPEETASMFQAALYPDSKVKRRGTWMTLTPNPYYERRMAIPKHNRVIDRLESFNDIIARLEGDDVINAHGEESVRVMLYRTTVEDAPDAAE
uniref:Uncharacterized protein n=1 Tax=Arthroderma gypseum TaxID=63402 RepID=C6GBP2_ARTGY|nr:unknown [Nannizzia gypsea]ACS91140.1 unknown [Nannizzia gypsea]